jgi:hypothetical protein
VRIYCEILFHVFVHFFLKVNTNGAINPNNLIRAHTRVCRHVAAGVGNVYVRGDVADGMVRAFDRSYDKLLQKCFVGGRFVCRSLPACASQRYHSDNERREQGD